MKKTLKKRIFSTLLDTKYKYFTLGLLSEKYFKYDRRINIFLTLASSGSIAAWAVWDKFTWIWGFVIVISQIVNLIKPYFQYSKYSKEFSQKYILLQSIVNQYEKFYFRIQYDRITEDQAFEDFFELKQEIENIIVFSNETVFDVSKTMEDKAKYKMKIYLKKNFNISLDNYQKISKNE